MYMGFRALNIKNINEKKSFKEKKNIKEKKILRGFRAHNSLCVCVEGERDREGGNVYFTARTLLYRPVHRTNKKSTPRWKVRTTRLRYIKIMLGM